MHVMQDHLSFSSLTDPPPECDAAHTSHSDCEPLQIAPFDVEAAFARVREDKERNRRAGLPEPGDSPEVAEARRQQALLATGYHRANPHPHVLLQDPEDHSGRRVIAHAWHAAHDAEGYFRRVIAAMFDRDSSVFDQPARRVWGRFAWHVDRAPRPMRRRLRELFPNYLAVAEQVGLIRGRLHHTTARVDRRAGAPPQAVATHEHQAVTAFRMVGQVRQRQALSSPSVMRKIKRLIGAIAPRLERIRGRVGQRSRRRPATRSTGSRARAASSSADGGEPHPVALQAGNADRGKRCRLAGCDRPARGASGLCQPCAHLSRAQTIRWTREVAERQRSIDAHLSDVGVRVPR